MVFDFGEACRGSRLPDLVLHELYLHLVVLLRLLLVLGDYVVLHFLFAARSLELYRQLLHGRLIALNFLGKLLALVL